MFYVVFIAFTAVFISSKNVFAAKYYVVERAGGSLGIISHNGLAGRVNPIGNGTHVIVYFGNRYGYALGRNGYLSKIDPETDKIILQKKVSGDTVDFCLSKNFIAVAGYKPQDVVILNKNFKVLHTIKTGSRNIGAEFYKNMHDKILNWGGNQSGNRIINIDYSGFVKPDPFFKYSGGNIKERDFFEIINNDKLFLELRQTPRKLKGRCEKCNYLRICNGGSRARAYAVYGDYFQEDPACFM